MDVAWAWLIPAALSVEDHLRYLQDGDNQVESQWS